MLGAQGWPCPEHAFRTHALEAGMSAELKEVLAGQQSRGERGGPRTGDRALCKRGEGLAGARAGGTAAGAAGDLREPLPSFWSV